MDNMPVESAAMAWLLKIAVGFILAPWLWYERKRVDKLALELAEQYTKEEVKEQITLRNKPIIDKLDMIYNELQRQRKD